MSYEDLTEKEVIRLDELMLTKARDMTLYDYFAAQALPALIASSKNPWMYSLKVYPSGSYYGPDGEEMDLVAERAYSMALMMMKHKMFNEDEPEVEDD